MNLINGNELAQQVRTEITDTINKMVAEGKQRPGLALLLVGENPASQVYVNSKDKDCKEVGMYSEIRRMPAESTQDEIIAVIKEWNADEKIHGMIVQLPLPKHVNEFEVISTINPEKDVDGFHPINAGRLLIGMPCFVSCTPAGVVEMIKRFKIETKGKHVVVVGRSNIVGKPMANLMYQKNEYANAVVTICHTGAKDITQYTRQADILIVAVGVPLLIKKEDVKPGAVVIDVGMNRITDETKKSGYRLVGDVDFDDVKDVCSFITPVPGGVGPMTRAMLLHNTLLSATKGIY